MKLRIDQYIIALVILAALMIAFCQKGYGQEIDSLRQIKVDSICAERGHDTFGSAGISTAMWCPPYTVDLPDKTLLITPHCNTTTCICRRCGKTIVYGGGGADTTVIWERKK